ncbi:MAG: hypothetical protein M3Q69_16970 [Acidobacteriota bacterium]|nr:hypothetical protein [Acidobacteriota bacterium]
MPEHIQYEDDDLFNPETHHESSDVPVRSLLWFIVIFILFAIITHVVLLFMYKGMAKMERNRMDPPQTAVHRPATADIPQNQPLLQPFPRKSSRGEVTLPQSDTPVVDLVKMREAEDETLKNYGWVDKQRGIVHMPIEQAKQLLAARLAVQGQLGAATTPPAAPAATTTAPALPGSTQSPAGQPVGPDSGVPQPAATTNTTGGTHQ